MPLSLSAPPPGLSLSSLQKNPSPAGRFLCDSFQASQRHPSLAKACRMLQPFLPKGLHSSSGNGRCWVFFPLFLSFFVLFVCVLLLLNLHIPELSCWTAPPPNSCQTPPTRRQQTRNKQHTERNFKVYSEKRVTSKAVVSSPRSSLL